MPILSNPRHERFAQELAKGKTATEAYVLAGYKPDDGNASKLTRKVAERVQEITGKAAERAEVSKAAVLAELAKLGFANMADYMRAGPDGDPYLDFSKLTRDQAAALVECTVEDFKEGRGENARDVRRVKFKLADKRSALVDIGKHLGLFVERIEHTGAHGGPIETKDVTARELVERRIASLTARGAAEGGSRPH